MGALVLVACFTLGLHLGAMIIAYFGARRLGLDRVRRVAVAFGGSQKSLQVSLLLVNGYFRATPLAVVPVLLYHVGQTLIDTLLIDVFRNRHAAATIIPFPALADKHPDGIRPAGSSPLAGSAPADSQSGPGDARAA